jgi:uncharacterized protein (DUF2252 family)
MPAASFCSNKDHVGPVPNDSSAVPPYKISCMKHPAQFFLRKEMEMLAAVVPFRSPSRTSGMALSRSLPADHKERHDAGKTLRERMPRVQHEKWAPAPDRRDPVSLILESGIGRIQELLPIRYGRMMVSPFTFYRGTAGIMAADLAQMPVSGLHAQICGDCHLMNLGGFATAERRLIFDINDFDETLPGPWEWDVKRLAASFVLACRSNGFATADQRDAALTCVRSYREHMRKYSGAPALEIWYANVDSTDVLASVHNKDSRDRLRKRIQKEEERESTEHDFPAMAEQKEGGYVIKENPPLIYHHPLINLESNRANIQQGLARYRSSLEDDRKILLDRYHLMDLSLKVVGIGSVGTLCCIALMVAAKDDHLFLQIKEAHPSVLERYAGRSKYANHGERVVTGQRVMQSASDIFLGWTHGKAGRHFYIRQLRDMKIKPLVDVFDPATMMDYAALCGWTLARAHARSADPAMIAGYMGKSDVFDRAITGFAVSYADQAERDHARFKHAIRIGKIGVEREA